MENLGWRDPLLITDVSCQRQPNSRSQDPTITTPSLKPPEMEDPDLVPPSYASDGVRWHDEEFGDPVNKDFFDGRTMLGFSLTSPDLVVCTGSPDIPAVCFEESPKFLKKKKHASIEVSLDNGINGPEMEDLGIETPIASNSHSSLHLADSFELLPPGSPMIVTEQPKAEELEELRKAVLELKRENEIKDRQCQEALKSLQDLHKELMHKSMHVGSLAFAIEGQVKEKSKWFSSLRDMKRNVKMLKLEQIKLSEEVLLYNKKCLADLNDVGSIIQANLNQKLQSHESLKLKFMKADKERKEHYNKILELKGNIRVFCRCRPLNTEEISSGASSGIEFETANDGELTIKTNGVPKKLFKFDRVFGPEANQGDVFEDTAPFASSVLDGYNVCIFAYGQTGTGKTFTMVGTEEARGVNFRTLEQLFQIIKERKEQFRYEITVSVLEVYNEQIRDLLASETKKLEIRQIGDGINYVPGLVEAPVNNFNEVWKVLETGNNARAVGSTNANEQSSRSHCIHCVIVKGENLLNGECTRSKLWLVDLAGSERIAKTEVQGERLKETQNINRSLSALGDVISALATKSPHIPFRNSKLTHLLQDSLGGDSKTLMFVQISPNENDLSETICSLNFASRVKGVELGPAKKQLDNTELFKFKQMAEKTKLDIKTKDIQIKSLEDTIYGLDVKVKEKDFKNKSLQEKVKELESQLLIERRLARQHVDSKLAEQQQREERNYSFLRPPLVARPLEDYRYLNETKLNQMQPLTKSRHEKDDDVVEKENTAEQPPVPKSTGRVSLCPITQRFPKTEIVPRRCSLIPLPLGRFPPPMPRPLPTIKADEDEENNEAGLPGFGGQWDNNPKIEEGGKKMTGTCLLRRSLKKNIMPMRRGGINVGMEKVRVSIGSRGRMNHRVLLNSARRAMKDIQSKQNHKDKERGWNI